MELTRRNFITLFSAAIVTPFVPTEAVQPEIIAEADFGFTWGAVKAVNPSFDTVIKETLRKRASEVAKNVSEGNSVLIKLTEKQAIKLNRISAEDQTKRIWQAVNAKRMKFDHDLRTDPYNTVQAVRNSNKGRNVFHEPYGPINHIVET